MFAPWSYKNNNKAMRLTVKVCIRVLVRGHACACIRMRICLCVHVCIHYWTKCVPSLGCCGAQTEPNPGVQTESTNTAYTDDISTRMAIDTCGVGLIL